jgi:3-hydroxybutyryl-CoA dehydratase
MEVIKHITITEKLVKRYADLIGDRNPIHLDEKYAKTTIFKKRIAHGMLVSSFISNIIANNFPGNGSIYLSQDLKFLKPCYLGDKLQYVVKQVDKVNSKFYLSTKVYNQTKDLILDGSAVVLKK